MPSEFFDRLTEDVGGENNAYTANDVTVFYETVPSNYLERLLFAEAERLTELTVDVRNFTLEREGVKEEYRQRVVAESSRMYQSLVYRQELAQSADFAADLRASLGLLNFQLILSSGVPIEKAE